MAENFTPMMQQYFDIKKNYPDTILMFRLGDFYEMFFDDAVLVSRELELVLTGRACGDNKKAPMCGVPYHAVDSYLARLVSKGYKVAICEQTEDPATAKGIVKRDVIRIVSPGTVIESGMLDESKNNYLAVAYLGVEGAGLCFADISTGKISLTSLTGKNLENSVINEIERFSPSEIIVNKLFSKSQKVTSFISQNTGTMCEVFEESRFDGEDCKKAVLSLFSEEKVREFGFYDDILAIKALGCCITYLSEMQKSGLDNVTDVEYYSEKQFMHLDYFTRRNLEIVETLRGREKKGSLLWVLDKTKTPMGKRLLRDWLDKPLVNVSKIMSRLNAVSQLYGNPILCGDITKALSSVFDIERVLARIVYSTANAKELNTLKATCRALPELKNLTSSFECEALKRIHAEIDTLEDIEKLIDSAIVEDPPLSVKEGGIIKKGFNSQLDELKDIDENGKEYITGLQIAEQEKTGIKKLKIGYNKVFGYYIEVSNSFKDAVPDYYIRKQTLTNGERYITEELKNFENKIVTARDKMVRLEYEIFSQIRQKISDNFRRIRQTADAVARLDVFCSLAVVAVENNYTRPDLTLDNVIEIVDGRHPVVEKMLNQVPFVPNDTLLDTDKNRCAIITGPNMAGKSTYMRQVALITLLTQIGSFVPARRAKIGICDSIFTRVGASDDLSSGSSTFMVEMSEVASILKNATNKSLVILDEIGRGTATYDGMSIAAAVVEYVTNKKRLGAKTLFATHYHELTEMENKIDGVKNYNVSVKKRNDEIIFLRRIIKGRASGSYGIEVAKLAGVPDAVTSRARKILTLLEQQGTDRKVSEPAKGEGISPDKYETDNYSISFESRIADEIFDDIRNIDIDVLTPIEALNILYKLINKTKQG